MVRDDVDYGLRSLGVAVVEKALEDYRAIISKHNKLAKAARTEANQISLYNNDQKLREVESFFRSDLFIYYVGDTVSGERIIDKIKKDMKYSDVEIVSPFVYKILLSRRYRDGDQD